VLNGFSLFCARSTRIRIFVRQHLDFAAIMV
jgi:hypothetical protein